MGKKKKKLCYSVVTHILGAHTHTCTHTVFAGTSNLSTLTLDLVIYIYIYYISTCIHLYRHIKFVNSNAPGPPPGE